MDYTIAPPEIDVHPLITKRFSARQFSERPVEQASLLRLFEAARWAPSSRNMQPWQFIVATKDQPEEYEKMFNLLKEGNQSWAGSAPVLILVLAENRDYERGNRISFHDAGLAVANLTVQALAEDIYVHQMGGFYTEQARQAYGIPKQYEPVTVLAVGYLADEGERELRPRQRKPLQDFVFSGVWGQSWAGFKDA